AREAHGVIHPGHKQRAFVIGKRRGSVEQDALVPGLLRSDDALWASGRAGSEKKDLGVAQSRLLQRSLLPRRTGSDFQPRLVETDVGAAVERCPAAFVDQRI